jgi:hypothetical protein
MTIPDGILAEDAELNQPVVCRGAVAVPASDRLSGWLTAVRDALVPLGYEDDLGFHYGSPPASGAE